MFTSAIAAFSLYLHADGAAEGQDAVIEQIGRRDREKGSGSNGTDFSYSPSESIGWRTSLTRSALLFGVAIAAHFLTCLGPRLGHERIGLWSPLEDSWLNAPGASTHPRRGDEQQKAADTDCIVGATTALLPAEPDLHGMLEAQLTWDLVGKQGGLRHQ